MTEEAKKNLLDYMLGKMPSESGVEEETFQSINETLIRCLFFNMFT